MQGKFFGSAVLKAGQRIRIEFSKQGRSLKYVGHLDLLKMWERVLRRAQLGLTYSQGFNARPKMQLASPLPLGLTSEVELLDVWLDEPLPLDDLAERLTSVSPAGLVTRRVREVALNGPALPTLVESGTYRIHSHRPIPDLAQRVADLMAQPRIIRTHRERAYDLKSVIYRLEVDAQGNLLAELALGSATGRPDELVEALGLPMGEMEICRVALRLSHDA